MITNQLVIKWLTYLVDERTWKLLFFISEDITSRIGREKLAGFNEAVAERKVKSALINAKDITVQAGYDMGKKFSNLSKIINQQLFLQVKIL